MARDLTSSWFQNYEVPDVTPEDKFISSHTYDMCRLDSSPDKTVRETLELYGDLWLNAQNDCRQLEGLPLHQYSC